MLTPVAKLCESISRSRARRATVWHADFDRHYARLSAAQSQSAKTNFQHQDITMITDGSRREAGQCSWLKRLLRPQLAELPVVRYVVPMATSPINLQDDIQPVSDFRANTADSLRRLRETGRPLVLTQNGRSAAVLLDVASYQALVDENDLLRDLHAGLDDAREGRVTAHAVAKAELLARYRP